MVQDPYPADRRDLICRLLQNHDRDSLLRLSVVLCDAELEGDGASFLLLDSASNRLALQESTVLTNFLGQIEKLDLTKEEPAAEKIRRLLDRHGQQPEDLRTTVTASRAAAWDPELVERLGRFGLTRWALVFGRPLAIENIQEDVRWSGKGLPELELGQETNGSRTLTHCELSRAEIGSIVLAPVGHPGSRYRGVLRVVRKRGCQGFGARELEWATWLASQLDRYMDVAVSLTELLDLGTKLEVKDFGNSLVLLLQRVLGARGCSIFLELEPPVDSVRTFSCIATTGLYDRHGRIDESEASYEVDMERDEADWLTGWVLRFGQILALDSSYDYDRAQYPGIREPGEGRYSETPRTEKKSAGGPILIAPLFLQQGREVAGAIRLIRPKGKTFQTSEQLFFVDIARRLSSVVTNLRFRQASERLIERYDEPDEMLREATRDIRWLLDVDGCSVFRRDGRYLRLEATAGALEGQEGIIKYDLQNKKTRGWTPSVAREKKPLLLNSPIEATQRVPPLEHSDNQDCETGVPAYRFLAVPIFQKPEDPESEVLGVIRAPRREEDPPFREEHQSILVSFAARVSLALNLTRRRDQLRAVVDVSNPVKREEEPARFAREVVEQAVKILIDEVGFEFAAVYKLDHLTRGLDLRLGKSVRKATDPRKRQAFPYFTETATGGVRAAAADEDPESGEGREIVGWEAPELEMRKKYPDLELVRFVFPIQLGTQPLGTIEAGYDISAEKRPIRKRQKYLVRMLAGFCASALYNEIVFDKLDDIHQGLVRVGKEMRGDSPLKDKLTEIAGVAASVTRASNVIIFEYFGPAPEGGSTAGRFRESACGGPRPPSVWRETNFTPDSVPYRIIQRDRPIFASEARKSRYLYHRKNGNRAEASAEVRSNFIDREGINSAAALRLKAGDMVLGCIFFNYRSKLKFDAQKRQEIALMAEYATVAIYQVRLLEDKSYLLRYTKHSLTQPLSTLLGYLENLAKGIYRKKLRPSDLDDEEAFRGSEFARQAEQHHRLGQYIKYIVDAFLHVDRAETGRLRSKESGSAALDLFHIDIRSEADLSETCRRAVEVAAAYLMGEIRQEIQPEVRGDFDLNAIKTAVLNVLANAIKYSEDSGIDIRGSNPIELRLSTFEEAGAGWARIQVDDPGPGVPKSQQKAIFERGFRRHDTVLGLGIGLFLTRGFIEAHGGKVWVEDSHLDGARFVMQLPLKHHKEGDE